MRDVVLRGLAVVVIGLCVGVGLALALTRVLEGSLYGVTPTDPVTFATAVAGLFLVSLVAVWVPARRAVAIQPIEALRIE
jgi:ABC-type antimicrobial peptide transport system permease subunit